MRRFLLALLAVSAFAAEPSPNTLTAAEIKAGWQLLFDGTTWNGWDFHHAADGRESVWLIEDGWIRALARTPGVRLFATDLPTKAVFGDFEMTFEWKLPAKGNSGVKYRVQGYLLPASGDRTRNYKRQELGVVPDFSHATHDWPVYPIGFEYQIYDDAEAMDHHVSGTGALYEILPPSPFRPVDLSRAHTSRIVARGKHVEHWLDGVKVVDSDLDTEPIKATLRSRAEKASEIKEPQLAYDRKELAEKLLTATMQPSPVILQYHDTDVRFRNIKIRQLSSKATVRPK